MKEIKNWHEYSDEFYHFAINEGNAHLDADIRTIDSIDSKARYLLLFSVPALCYLVLNLFTPGLSLPGAMQIGFALPLLLSVYYGIKVIWQYEIFDTGSEPDLVFDDVADEYKNVKLRHKALLHQRCQAIQSRIEFNRLSTLGMPKNSKLSLLYLVASPLVSLAFQLINKYTLLFF